MTIKKNYVRAFQVAFEEHLRRELAFASPEGLYEPLHYLMKQGGKRIRPILLLMATGIYDDSFRPGLHAALAIELFHNFTLAHDDIMDEAALRRGKPTVHRKYGMASGILTGDLALIYAYRHLLFGLSPNLSLRVLAIFNGFAVDVCRGQQLDMDFESREDITMDEYLQMITWKTAVLPAGALQIGALIGGAPEEDARILHEFGIQLGLAFQLQDDWLDTFGDQQQLGKRIGGDILQKKKTALVIAACKNADEEQARSLYELLRSDHLPPEEKIQKVRRRFEQLGAGEEVAKLQQQYMEKALSLLGELPVPDLRKENLRLLAHSLIDRKL